MMLVPNKQMQLVSGGEPRSVAIFVVTNAVPQRTGHTNINRTTIAIGDDVNRWVFFLAHILKLLCKTQVGKQKLDAGLRQHDGVWVRDYGYGVMAIIEIISLLGP